MSFFQGEVKMSLNLTPDLIEQADIPFGIKDHQETFRGMAEMLEVINLMGVDEALVTLVGFINEIESYLEEAIDVEDFETIHMANIIQMGDLRLNYIEANKELGFYLLDLLYGEEVNLLTEVESTTYLENINQSIKIDNELRYSTILTVDTINDPLPWDLIPWGRDQCRAVTDSTPLTLITKWLRFAKGAVFVFRNDDPYIRTRIDHLYLFSEAVRLGLDVFVVETGNREFEMSQIAKYYTGFFNKEESNVVFFSGDDVWRDVMRYVVSTSSTSEAGEENTVSEEVNENLAMHLDSVLVNKKRQREVEDEELDRLLNQYLTEDTDYD